MPASDRQIYADPGAERLLTGATVITAIRTVASLALSLAAVVEGSRLLLVLGLAVYWIGDMAEGAWARLRACATGTGAVGELLCDGLNCAPFCRGLAWLDPVMAIPVGIYLLEFMVVDAYLSLAFLAWPVRSPNYFYAVDRRIWRWNWSKPAKAVNSALFAVLLLVTGWWELGVLIATALLVLKCVSLRWLLQLGLPVPERVAA